MPATRKLPHPTDVVPERRRGEIIGIIASGLVRLVGAGPSHIVGTAAAANMFDEKPSESAKIGLELSGETRISVPAG